MTDFKVFYDADDDAPTCEVAEIEELGVFDCDEIGTYRLEGRGTTLRLCAHHKDAAKEAGVAA